jgi:hypothetical protein
MGQLGSFGDSFLQKGIDNTELGNQLQVGNNFLAGNLANLTPEQDIAEKRAYKPISPLGGILSGLGGMMGGMGGGGGGFLG